MGGVLSPTCHLRAPIRTVGKDGYGRPEIVEHAYKQHPRYEKLGEHRDEPGMHDRKAENGEAEERLRSVGVARRACDAYQEQPVVLGGVVAQRGDRHSGQEKPKRRLFPSEQSHGAYREKERSDKEKEPSRWRAGDEGGDLFGPPRGLMMAKQWQEDMLDEDGSVEQQRIDAELPLSRIEEKDKLDNDPAEQDEALDRPLQRPVENRAQKE